MQTLTLSLKQHTSRQTFPISQILPHISTENFLFVSVYFFPSYFFLLFSLSHFVVVGWCFGSVCWFRAQTFLNVKKPMKKGKEKHTKMRITFSWNFLFVSLCRRRAAVQRRKMCVISWLFLLWDFLSTLWARLQTIHKVLGSFSLYGTLSTKRLTFTSIELTRCFGRTL